MSLIRGLVAVAVVEVCVCVLVCERDLIPFLISESFRSVNGRKCTMKDGTWANMMSDEKMDGVKGAVQGLTEEVDADNKAVV